MYSPIAQIGREELMREMTFMQHALLKAGLPQVEKQ